MTHKAKSPILRPTKSEFLSMFQYQSATYDRDSKRSHRYLIDEGQGITGTLYVPKEERQIPRKILSRLRVKPIKRKQKAFMESQNTQKSLFYTPIRHSCNTMHRNIIYGLRPCSLCFSHIPYSSFAFSHCLISSSMPQSIRLQKAIDNCI